MNFSVFTCIEEDSVGKPLYSRFIKTNDFKGVPHPLSGDYTPKPQEEIDESLYVYGKKGPQEPEPSVSDDRSSEYSTCQSNDSAGSIGNSSKHSVDLESEISRVSQEVYVSKPITTNEKGVSTLKSKEVEPSCVTHIKTPRQPIKDQETPKVNRKNWNATMERELGEGYSFTKKKCFVCGSLSHLIKDCDYYEKKMAREAASKKQRVFNTGKGVTKPVWNNADRINHVNHFVPRSVILNSSRPNVNSVRPNVNNVRTNINSVRQNVNSVWSNVNTGRFNVNFVLPKQPVPTSNSPNFSSARPQVNKEIGDLLLRPQHVITGDQLDQTPIVMDHPLKNMVDRGIFDSGCSGHMTGNKDQLEDFKEFNGGSVTFGGSKGYITGKGRIRVGNLDFDSASLVKELGNFNLFLVSQICDKQHKVLFTETECLVVSSDFKMPDENQILLKVPRHHNMYSFDMKRPTPTKGFACLIAKATSDESKIWPRRCRTMLTATRSEMTQEAINELIAKHVEEALKAYDAAKNPRSKTEMENEQQDNNVEANVNNGNGNGNGNGNPNVNNKDDTLTWWNLHKRIVGVDVAYTIMWKALMKLMTQVYCPRNEIQKIEIELWNLIVKGNDLTAYSQLFKELTLLCTKMVPEEEDQVEKYIRGLPDNIQGNVIAAEPTRL
ncbi:ribonuclease H-like domain-containing protein [Tanacetum coccineum]